MASNYFKDGEPSKYLTMTVSASTTLLAAIILADMGETLWVINRGYAKEGNPLIAWALTISPLAFALVKLATVLPTIYALEVCRWRRPKFARIAGSVAVFAYLIVYIVGMLHTQGKI